MYKRITAALVACLLLAITFPAAAAQKATLPENPAATFEDFTIEVLSAEKTDKSTTIRMQAIFADAQTLDAYSYAIFHTFNYSMPGYYLYTCILREDGTQLFDPQAPGIGDYYFESKDTVKLADGRLAVPLTYNLGNFTTDETTWLVAFSCFEGGADVVSPLPLPDDAERMVPIIFRAF